MENKNMLIAIAAIAVVAIAIVAAFLLLNNNGGGNNNDNTDTSEYLTADSGKATVSSVDTKLLVFGNANNDVYLNNKDVTFIQNIVDGKSTWNKTSNPLADTNADGKITKEDVSLLKCFIEGKSAPMFYVNDMLETVKITFPLTGKIAIGAPWTQTF
ncbi:MAG: dockerin type I repeat-containing protein [Candidatus Methanomethylophilaceae archaeon]|nr:dockerin type I repeat-containing protein [Candidatus Methanomethylophilaceae archaeon]